MSENSSCFYLFLFHIHYSYFQKVGHLGRGEKSWLKKQQNVTWSEGWNTAQKMKFSIKDFFSKYNQIRRKLRVWSHLLKKYLMANFIFRAVVFMILQKAAEDII